MLTDAVLRRPENAIWFGLQVRAGHGWERCEKLDWKNEERWWRISQVDPEAILRRGAFPDGTYRVIWCCDNDRRSQKKWRFSDPFDVAIRAEEPRPATLPVDPPPPLPPWPPFVSTHTPPPVVPHIAQAVSHIEPNHPMALFYALHAVYRDDRQTERERDLAMFQLTLETIRAQNQLALQQTHQFHTLMVGAQQAVVSERREIETERRQHEQQTFLQKLDVVREGLARLSQAAEDEDEEEEEETDPDVLAQNALARMGENPSDGERVLQGIASVMQTIATFAQTPLGNALAKKVFPGLEAQIAAQQAAAE